MRTQPRAEVAGAFRSSALTSRLSGPLCSERQFRPHLGRSPNFRHRLLSGEAAIRDLSFENFALNVGLAHLFVIISH